jgi:O-antigen/teichoic acid export membrane protein
MSKLRRFQELTSNRLLFINSFYSLLGQVLPLLAAVFSIPLIIRGFGNERFGILTIAWMIIGYFSLFDLGLGRALTQLVSQKIGEELEGDTASLIWTSLMIMFILGCVGGLIFSALAPWLSYTVLKVSESLQMETLCSFYLLAFSVPLVTINSGLTGILSAFQRFDLMNAARIPLGLYFFLSPLLVLAFSQNLCDVIKVLLLGRLISILIHLWFCFYVMPSLRKGMKISMHFMPSLLKFGGWMTLSNIVSPLMANMDRILIGSMISVSAVAFYTTPYELVTKFWIIPTAVTNVLFPAFSTSFHRDPRLTQRLFNQGCKSIFIILFLISITVIIFSKEILSLWLGDNFSDQSSLVLQVLMIGILVNSTAQVPFGLLQSVGRPDITAKLHLFELPIYLPVLWILTYKYGIVGSAFAWLLRAFGDTLLLFIFSLRYVPQNALSVIKQLPLPTSMLILALAISHQPIGISKLLTFFGIMLLFVLSIWKGMISPHERVSIISFLSGKMHRSFK